MPETSGDADTQSQQEPRSWKEWYSWRKLRIEELRYWRRWTWRDKTAATVAVVAALVVWAVATYEEPTPSSGCRSKVEREMVRSIKSGLIQPDEMKKAGRRPNPAFLGGIFTEGENDYGVNYFYTYPNGFGGRDERVARGLVTYIAGSTCDFWFVSTGE